jgi:lipopolysaccharide/colanic/teichoic acid biosynthesis glycosyltransferase
VPQLINVLRGEMSLIGPRPPLAYEVGVYERWQLERLSARPGITGLWQVSGRNRLTHRQMCELDIRYVREWNLALDVKIALRTPWVMLVDKGGAS